MGRSSKEEALRTRARIIEASCELFRENGVEQTSVADVMGSLGMTTGGFYKHFECKDALVAEAMIHAFSQSNAAWQSIGDDNEDSPDAHMARLVAFYLRPNPIKRCPMIAFSTLAGKAEIGEASRDAYAQGSKALLDCFTHPNKRGKPAAEPHAMVLFAAMIGARVLNDAANGSAWAKKIRAAVLDAAAKHA